MGGLARQKFRSLADFSDAEKAAVVARFGGQAVEMPQTAKRSERRDCRSVSDMSSEEKAEIHRLYIQGEPLEDLMKAFHISAGTLSAIKSVGIAPNPIIKPKPQEVYGIPEEMVAVIAQMRADKTSVMTISRELGLSWDAVFAVVDGMGEGISDRNSPLTQAAARLREIDAPEEAQADSPAVIPDPADIPKDPTPTAVTAVSEVLSVASSLSGGVIKKKARKAVWSVEDIIPVEVESPVPEAEPEPTPAPAVIPDEEAAEPEPQTETDEVAVVVYDNIPAFLLDPENPPLSVKEIPDDRKVVAIAEPLPVTQPNLNDKPKPYPFSVFRPVGFQPVAVPYETISLIAEMRLGGSTLSQIRQRTKIGPAVLRRLIISLKDTGAIPAPVVRRGGQRTDKPEDIIGSVRTMRSQGMTIAAIKRELGISRRVVARIVHAIEPDWKPPKGRHGRQPITVPPHVMEAARQMHAAGSSLHGIIRETGLSEHVLNRILGRGRRG